MDLLLIMFIAAITATATIKTATPLIAMSFFAWFTNLFDGIGKVFRNLMKKAKPFLQKQIPVGIAIVNILKECVENPLMKFANAAIPGNLDDIIVDQAKRILPELTKELKLFHIAADSDSNEQIIESVIAYLRSIAPEKRYGKYIEIASYLNMALVDGKLSWAEVLHLTQIAHDEDADKVAIAA